MQTHIKPWPAPGTVVSVAAGPLGLFRHVGIVSGRCSSDMPMVISNSARARQVAEEPWPVFSAGTEVRVLARQPELGGWAVVEQARSLLGKPWDLLGYNCEHFVAEACGEPIESMQLRRWGAAAAIIAVIAIINAAGKGSGRPALS